MCYIHWRYNYIIVLGINISEGVQQLAIAIGSFGAVERRVPVGLSNYSVAHVWDWVRCARLYNYKVAFSAQSKANYSYCWPNNARPVYVPTVQSVGTRLHSCKYVIVLYTVVNTHPSHWPETFHMYFNILASCNMSEKNVASFLLGQYYVVHIVHNCSQLSISWHQINGISYYHISWVNIDNSKWCVHVNDSIVVFCVIIY